MAIQREPVAWAARGLCLRPRHPTDKAMMLVPAKISSKKNCSANMRGFALELVSLVWTHGHGPCVFPGIVAPNDSHISQ
jgi:hypothetical protein